MKKIAIFFVLAVMTASIFAGCGQKSDSGTVSTDGSTSMEKVIGALGEAFEQEYDSVTFTNRFRHRHTSCFRGKM